MRPSDPPQEPISLWEPPTGTFPPTVRFGLPRRRGGVSRGPYASLNVGLGVHDEEAAVLENRRRVRALVGMEEGGPRLLHQVHGRMIVRPNQAPCEADGFFVREGDPWVAVSAADCAPVALVVDDASSGALLHCGWRGARERIASHAVARLTEDGVRPESLRASVGPCLMACCFPIGPEVAAEFDPALLRSHPSGQPSLDLPEAIAAALVEAGVPREQIHLSSECTSCGIESYFSHRRDRGVTGRHWAFLHLRDPGR